MPVGQHAAPLSTTEEIALWKNILAYRIIRSQPVDSARLQGNHLHMKKRVLKCSFHPVPSQSRELLSYMPITR